MSAPPELPRTRAALRGYGHVHRSVSAEVRENLLRLMGSGKPRFPGVLGFDSTVLPQVERALLAGHDLVLLGERGQGKTRLIRSLVGLLDEWSPAVAGCQVNDHPYAPVCPVCVRRSAEEGDRLPVVWRHRRERYGEKLGTPDTGVGELVGDVDPARLAEGRSLGDPETVHYGLVPRANRGVFCVNELPDLPARAQVALFNVLEERDLQVRGYSLRLPLDLLVVASANPEDYTSRGRIVTPLKDRFGAQVRTHYPLTLEDELALVRQEAVLPEGTAVPAHVWETAARFTRLVRASKRVDARSGVSVRFAVAAAETAAASALRRSALTGGEAPVARVCDLAAAVEPLLGKVEFELGTEGREPEVLHALLRRATAEAFRERLGGTDLSALVERFTGGATVESGDLVGAAELLRRIGAVPGLAAMIAGAAPESEDGPPTPGLAAAVVEFALEGLYLERRLSKDVLPGGGVYRF
ncbi:sigma 54-interacting transcriptional regulator [Nocardiopsis tropica]|uniref:Sigma 54-interacting transcriptional regulator n=1 Tax=Nocardiopsis tropica TaxID=109330 RepID=A0ABU7L297_9ACTN|nr:sigma 54-interacting transcriptional regulator [Nocardiopsis umidischolae]MEE2055447.1 sigma 54-interacting transcriptional regulator [Nocardiopsis umidischolae]